MERETYENQTPKPRGIAKHGRGAMAWISEERVRQKTQRREEILRDVPPKNESLSKRTATPLINHGVSIPEHRTTVDGIDFRVAEGGKKLLRVTGSS